MIPTRRDQGISPGHIGPPEHDPMPGPCRMQNDSRRLARMQADTVECHILLQRGLHRGVLCVAANWLKICVEQHLGALLVSLNSQIVTE